MSEVFENIPWQFQMSSLNTPMAAIFKDGRRFSAQSR
jgi:hypothetical protein